MRRNRNITVPENSRLKYPLPVKECSSWLAGYDTIRDAILKCAQNTCLNTTDHHRANILGLKLPQTTFYSLFSTTDQMKCVKSESHTDQIYSVLITTDHRRPPQTKCFRP